MASPQISVLIPAYNEQELLPSAIDSVRESFRAFSKNDYEIIVCDNNSTDGTAVAAAARGARVVFEPHNQIARARNAAAKEAGGEWLIFLDADARLNATVLKAVIDGLGSGKVCGGGSLMGFDGDIGRTGRFMLLQWTWLSLGFKLAAGAFVYCLRDAWLDTGGFDEEFYVAEELGFSRRVAKWGKPKGMKFRIIKEGRIISSSRKFDWFGKRAVLLQFVKLAVPGAFKRRKAAKQWYERPGP